MELISIIWIHNITICFYFPLQALELVSKARVAQLLGDEKSSTRRGSRSSLANSEHEQSHEEVSLSFFHPFVISTYKLAVCTSACHAVVDTNTYSRLLSFSSFFLFFFSFRPVVRHVRHNLIWPNSGRISSATAHARIRTQSNAGEQLAATGAKGASWRTVSGEQWPAPTWR